MCLLREEERRGPRDVERAVEKMATYLKRSSKLFERLAAVQSSKSSGVAGSEEQPQLRELICPVCRSLLREPVTLPCAHNLCLRCLRGTVEHSSLSCPLCRHRVGSWLRAANKQDSLVNDELWQLIRRTFPEELGLTHDAPDSLDLAAEFTPKKQISAAGEIRREYEVQLQMAEEQMRRQREKDRLASEALIRKIQEEEEQQKLVQLAQDQLLAKTLAKREVIDKTNDKHQCSSKSSTVVNSDKSNVDCNLVSNQSKSANNQKMSVKSKDVNDLRKLNSALISKIRRHASSVKSSATNVQKDPTETFSSQKPVPIHNAITRVVTHQSRGSQPNNTTYQAALGELVGSTSKIYGLQSKEELHVPSDVVSSNKKKLGVEVCVTTVEGEERIGSAESAGSHDSINQEIHHFKPIKALPRTPLRLTLDGRQVDPKLIRVLPKLKRVSNAVPKPPTPTHLKKMFGCSWSAFKRITKQQQTSQKDSSTVQQQQETKKTERKGDHSRTASKSSKSLQDLDERNSEVGFDSNKNYTKNIGKIINGTKVSKKLNLDEQIIDRATKQQSRRSSKLKNGLLTNSKVKSQKEPIEVVELDDEEDVHQNLKSKNHAPTPDPLELAPKQQDLDNPQSPVFEMAIVENIAERIKRRKTTRTASNTENVQSAINLVAPVTMKAKSKKTPSTKSRKQMKTKKATTTVIKSKPKVEKVTSVTSQIKRLAARSTKRPRYTEDTESEDEDMIIEQQRQSQASEEQRQLEANEVAELDRSNPELPPSPSVTTVPPKKPRKTTKTTTKSKDKSKSKSKSKKQKKDTVPVLPAPSATTTESLQNTVEEVDDTTVVQEQKRLERLAAQERADRELALKLQAQFAAMERIAGRTRRGAARVPSPLISINDEEQQHLKLESNEKRPRKRAAVK